MNLKFEALNIIRWMHFILLAGAGGGAVVALLLSGFEEGREDLQGLAATVWSKVVAWSLRLAIVAGISMLVLLLQSGQNPFKAGFYLHLKLTLVFVLLGLSEMTPRALATGKRGSALLVLVLFMAVAFTVFNKGLFRKEPLRVGPEVPVTAAR